MNFNLTPEMIDSIRADVVRELIVKHADEIGLVSKAQAAGILDVEAKTLDRMPIPRVVLVPKKKIAYRLSDITAFIRENVEH